MKFSKTFAFLFMMMICLTLTSFAGQKQNTDVIGIDQVDRFEQAAVVSKGNFANYFNLVFLNDSVTPVVAPDYGHCIYVNAVDSTKDGFIKKVSLSSNDPPVLKVTGKPISGEYWSN